MAVVSALLSLDLIANGLRCAPSERQHAEVVRYADDLVVGFEREGDANRFLDAMRERLGEFALSLHPDKTRRLRCSPPPQVQEKSHRPWAPGRSAGRWLAVL